MIGGAGDLALFERDNIAVDRIGRPLLLRGSYTTSPVKVLTARPRKIPGVEPMPAAQVEDAVIGNAGARPWDRDAIDARIVANVAEGRGAIIDTQEQVGGYPQQAPTREAFDSAQWDLATMTRRAR
jgi:hypothetical protein